MDKEEYYKLWGKIDSGYVANEDEVFKLLNFTDSLISLIETTAEDGGGDVFGTEGWEHAIGWD